LEKSQSLLERIKAAIQAARTGALLKSALAKACDYTLTLGVGSVASWKIPGWN
jgi:hypothetical protein